MALLQLIEAGKISYDTPAEDIIPELKNPVVVDDVLSATTGYRPANTKILIRHLLNHTSGLYYSGIGKPTPETLNLAYTAVGYGGDYSVEKFFNILRQGVCISLDFQVPYANLEVWTYVSRDIFHQFPSPLNLARIVSRFFTSVLEHDPLTIHLARELWVQL